MSNMLCLLRQRAAIPARHFTSIARCKNERLTCGVVKFYSQNELTPLQYSILPGDVQTRPNLSRSHVENVRTTPTYIGTPSSQLESAFQTGANRKCPPDDDAKETVTVSSITDSNLHLLQCLDICLAHKLNGIKKLPSLTSTSTWLPNHHHQSRRLLDGLFGHGRQDALTHSYLGPLSYSCRGLHLAPAICCKVPKDYDKKDGRYHALGTTFASDLCAESQVRLKEIAHEHLKKILRENKIKVVKNKPKKYPDRGLFNSPLHIQVEKDFANNRNTGFCRVPSLLRFFAMEIYQRGLETQGLFRISGSASRVKTLKAYLESDYYKAGDALDTKGYEIHDIASLMKEYLRELPAKLISTEKFEIFPEIEELAFKNKQYNVMNYFMLSMTPEHRESVQFLMSFLQEVAALSDSNKMNADNIATVMAPNVFKIGDVSNEEVAKRMAVNNKMFKLWFTYYGELTIVPDQLMEELRKSFNKSSAKIKFDPTLFPQLQKYKPPPAPANLASLTEATITVLTPYEKQPSKEIKIGPDHTAQQVVYEALGIPPPADSAAADDNAAGGAAAGDEQGAVGGDAAAAQPSAEKPCGTVALRYFKLEDFLRPDDVCSQFLYEIGGNMGERCLHPCTNLLNVYKANPKAIWVVKFIGNPPVHASKKSK